VIVGAAIVPTTALLLPGITERLPDGIAQVASAARRALTGLAPFDVAVLLAAGSPAAVHLRACTTLAGIGRPDLTIEAQLDPDAAEAVAIATGWPLAEVPVPLGLAVLAGLVREARPEVGVVPVAVPADDEAGDLLGAGERFAEALEGRRAVVVASGDLSAGLTAKAPLTLVEGAGAWEDELVDAVAGGRFQHIARMGPGEAARVGARGWAPLVVLAGACRAAALGLVVRHHTAPRGVGYLVAAGG
jgi:hypothetical protein